jgi:hypothetical protein
LPALLEYGVTLAVFEHWSTALCPIILWRTRFLRQLSLWIALSKSRRNSCPGWLDRRSRRQRLDIGRVRTTSRLRGTCCYHGDGSKLIFSSLLFNVLLSSCFSKGVAIYYKGSFSVGIVIRYAPSTKRWARPGGFQPEGQGCHDYRSVSPVSVFRHTFA